MKLIATNQIELSYANLKALMSDIERKIAQGRTPETIIYKGSAEGTFSVRVVTNEAHYSPEALADRSSPYLPPEAWAGEL